MDDTRLVYLNGDFLPLAQARISVMDRGFLFGDGVYEVIPSYGGRLLRLEQHLERLGNSLRAIGMQPPLPSSQWAEILGRLIAQHPGTDQSVYLQVTRGVAEIRDHAMPDGAEPTLFAMTMPIKPMPPEVVEQGVKAVTLDDVRWQLCHIKTTALLANVLLRQQALDQGAAEAVLIRDGQATEGAVSNLFVVTNGRLLTPPKGPLLLPGITRDLVLELAEDNAIPCAEAPVSETRLESADEIWLTSSTREILPVSQLNGRPVGGGRPGPLWIRMNRLYQAYKDRLRAGY